jgi:acetaldehyde dehydrogenase (acetylating)
MVTVRRGRIGAAIIGPGSVGTDLMYKILRSSDMLELLMVAGKERSQGIERAEKNGIRSTTDGIAPILENEQIKIVFDATGARSHTEHAPLLEAAGKMAIDLTPAGFGQYVVPAVNLAGLGEGPNVSMVTGPGQATIPIVYAVSRVAGARYAEIVSCVASEAAGPGARQDIDEATRTTANAIRIVGGAQRGKAIILMNPAEPPLVMTGTIYVDVEMPQKDAIEASVATMVRIVQTYVPGYRLRMPPMLDGHKVTVIIEVEGAGDYLPSYSGNLDIMTSAAIRVGDELARRILMQGN